MPPERRTGPSYMRGGVVACPKRRHPSPGCAPLTDGASAGTWRGETDASGLHGGDLAVGLARMLLQNVPMGSPNTTGWGGPLVKARPCKVKGLDPVVKRYRVRRDGGPGRVAMPPERRVGPSYMRGGVVACPKRRHASPGRAPPSRTAMTR